MLLKLMCKEFHSINIVPQYTEPLSTHADSPSVHRVTQYTDSTQRITESLSTQTALSTQRITQYTESLSTQTVPQYTESLSTQTVSQYTESLSTQTVPQYTESLSA